MRVTARLSQPLKTIKASAIAPEALRLPAAYLTPKTAVKQASVEEDSNPTISRLIRRVSSPKNSAQPTAGELGTAQSAVELRTTEQQQREIARLIVEGKMPANIRVEPYVHHKVIYRGIKGPARELLKKLSREA